MNAVHEPDPAHRASRLSRRRILGLSAVAVGTVAVAAWPRAAAQATDTDVLSWINRHAMPLARTDAPGPADDLRGLRDIVRDAYVVGLGESAHGTHTQLTLKHRVARYLVEHLGFRTIAWEEGWGSGVAIDRYVTTGEGDPRKVVGDAMFMLRTEVMLDLVGWMRDFNRGRPDHDKVRFLGSDVSNCARSSSTRSGGTCPTSRPSGWTSLTGT